MIEIDNGSLCWQPTSVIYKGKEFKTPIDIIILMSYDYILELLKSGNWKN